MTKRKTHKEISCSVLNSAYDSVHNLAKEGHPKDTPCFIWAGGIELEFKYDETAGRRGAWLLTTDVIVIDEDEDFSISEEEFI